MPDSCTRGRADDVALHRISCRMACLAERWPETICPRWVTRFITGLRPRSVMDHAPARTHRAVRGPESAAAQAPAARTDTALAVTAQRLGRAPECCRLSTGWNWAYLCLPMHCSPPVAGLVRGVLFSTSTRDGLWPLATSPLNPSCLGVPQPSAPSPRRAGPCRRRALGGRRQRTRGTSPVRRP